MKRAYARYLESQLNMAYWAKRMFLVALAETLITAAGVFLVFRTLEATRRAVGHAERAANAAQATVGSMQDTARRQLRAYIKFGIDVKNPATIAAGTRLIIPANMENTGQTPAVRVTQAGELAILSWPPPDPFPEAVHETDGALYTLHPNLRAPWVTPICSKRAYTAAEVQGALVGTTTRLYLFGWVKYFDVFGKEHYTRFRMMSGVEPKTNLVSFCPEGNETDDD